MNWGALIANFPYLVSVVVFGIGIIIVLTQSNLLKKVIGLNIMTSAVFLFYIAFGNIEGGVAPILTRQLRRSSISTPCPRG